MIILCFIHDAQYYDWVNMNGYWSVKISKCFIKHLHNLSFWTSFNTSKWSIHISISKHSAQYTHSLAWRSWNGKWSAQTRNIPAITHPHYLWNESFEIEHFRMLNLMQNKVLKLEILTISNTPYFKCDFLLFNFGKWRTHTLLIDPTDTTKISMVIHWLSKI